MKSEKHLISHLRSYADSLENDFIPFDGILGNLLILLENYGYLEKKEISYVRKLQYIDPSDDEPIELTDELRAKLEARLEEVKQEDASRMKKMSSQEFIDYLYTEDPFSKGEEE